MATYHAYQPSLHPTALADPYGFAWGATSGAMKDAVVELAVDAVEAGLVLLAPDDALVLLGADVALEPLPKEDDNPDAYRARIAGAWETWTWAGTRHALEVVCVQLDSNLIRLATAHELGRSPWAQYFVFLDGLNTHPRAWGAPEKWGEGVWGSDASREGVRRVRRLFRLFSNARDRGWIVFLQSTPGVWGAPATWGTGTWGSRNVRWRI